MMTIQLDQHDIYEKDFNVLQVFSLSCMCSSGTII